LKASKRELQSEKEKAKSSPIISTAAEVKLSATLLKPTQSLIASEEKFKESKNRIDPEGDIWWSKDKEVHQQVIGIHQLQIN